MKQTTNTAPTVGVSKWLTVEQFASEYGYSLKQVYTFTRNNVIPHYKPSGRLIKFKRTEVDEWVERGRIKSKSEREAEAEEYLNARS